MKERYTITYKKKSALKSSLFSEPPTPYIKTLVHKSCSNFLWRSPVKSHWSTSSRTASPVLCSATVKSEGWPSGFPRSKRGSARILARIVNAWVPVFASSRRTPCASLETNSLSSCRNRDEGIISEDWGSAGCIVACARPIHRRKRYFFNYQ